MHLETWVNAPTNGAYLSLASLEKYKNAKCQRPGCSTTDQIFTLQQIFKKSWEYAEDVYVFCRPRENMWPGSSWKVLGSFAVVRCWRRLLLAVKALYSCSEVCVRVGAVKITIIRRWCWTPTRVCTVSTPLRSLYELNWQLQPSRRCWKLQDQPFTFADDLVLLASSQQGLQRTLDRFSAASDRAGISPLEGPRYYVSLENQGSVSCNTLQHVEKFKYRDCIYVTEGGTGRLIHVMVKLTQFCVNFIALWWQNWSLQTLQSCQFLNQSFLRSSPVVINLG